MRTLYQIQNEIEIRKNQKVIRNINNELVVKNCPKNKKPIIQQPKINLFGCLSFRRKNGIEVDKGYFCQIWE